MELIQYIRLLRKWGWALILCAVVGGTLAYITTMAAPTQYQAQVTLSVGNFLESQNPTTQDINTGIALADTYAQILRTPNLHNAVIEKLSLSLTEDEFDNLVSTQTIAKTSLLQVSVTYVDPLLTADIANELAQQLIEQSPTNLTEEQQLQITSLNEHINAQSNDLQALRSQLNDIETELEDEDLSAARRQTLVEERSTLVDQINETNSNIAQYTMTLANIQQRTNSIEIIQQAIIPREPLSRNLVIKVLLAALIGAMLAFGLALLYEYSHDTFEDSNDVMHTLSVPTLGVISKIKQANKSYHSGLITELPPLSQIPEEYRTLRTNLLFALQDKRFIVVSSPLPQEGKTITAANLALMIAQAGMSVVLVDCDLRIPRQHEVFGLANGIGLTNLILNQRSQIARTTHASSEVSLARVPMPDYWQEIAQETEQPNLTVITSGFNPPNPTELLGSMLVKRWADQMLQSGVDYVIFDTPPILVASDAAVLASRLNAEVLLVIDAQKTKRGSAIEAVQRFKNVQVNTIGTLFNRSDPRAHSYYGPHYDKYYQNN